MTAPKTLVSWGYSAKAETTYATINANGVGDGVLLSKIPTVDPTQWLNMGDRGNTPGGGRRQDAPNSGRFGTMKLNAEGIGSKGTIAYAAGVKPQLDAIIQAAGFQATGSFTASQENWLYQPETQPAALQSVTTEATVAGQLYRLYGAYMDLGISMAGPGIPDWAFDVIGIQDFVVDAAIPAFTSYPNESDLPQKGDNLGLKIGLFTAGIVKSFNFKMNRAHKNTRVAMSGGAIAGIAGYTPGYYDPTLEVVIERCASLATVSPWNTATTLNPYRLAEDKLPIAIQMDFGATQYRRWHIQSGAVVAAGLPSPQAQAVLTSVKDTAEGPTGTWTLNFRFFNSTLGATNDAVSLLYN